MYGKNYSNETFVVLIIMKTIQETFTNINNTFNFIIKLSVHSLV